ncbi:MAG: family 78 glycoside hydrolase catalytic domain [Gemmatimonadaceae bacterium]|nr:family 78 glycoside hydrolase catalytic domain [Chitinophagaceae bacterium]
MKFIYLSPICVLLALSVNAGCIPYDLRCEYLTNPLGMDEPNPRLSWKIKTCDQAITTQTSYILFSTDSLALSKGAGILWKAPIAIPSQIRIEYSGPALKPYTRYYWKIAGNATSPIAFFETGHINVSNWRGSWITDNQDINLRPAAYFRKTFNATKKIKSARVFVAAAGLYELFINGKQSGDHRLDPAFTRFDRRILYVTHDVTALLATGKNAIGIHLGNGWYNHQSTAVWFFDLAPWRARPKFCLDLRIEYADGSIETIRSNNDWKTKLSPVISSNIYTAEHFDATLETKDWQLSSFVDSSWRNANLTPSPSQNIVSQLMHPIRDVTAVPTKKMTKFSDTNYLFDLGRNIAGVSEFTVSGKAGTTIRLIHAERIDKGHADQSNLIVHYRPKNDLDPFGIDIIKLSGIGAETFRAKFNYKGFQYVEVVSDAPITLTEKSLSGWFMHSDVPTAGTVHSSSDLLNKIWEATNNSYLSNLYGYPTDCPQREKNGWTGDGQIAVETGLYNFDGITVYEKWMADHRDEQQSNGLLPAIIPTAVWGYNWANGTDWTSSIAIIPWNVYMFYGDNRLLKKNYESIKKYVDYVEGISRDGLTDWGLGDWIPIKSESDKQLTSSIYFYTDARILADAAKLFQREEDYRKYSALALKIKNAINAKFLNRQTGIYASGVQTELSAPLFWGIVPAEMKTKVAAKLAARVSADGGLDVGLLGTKTILNALSENGYADIAYKLASADSFPSWGYWIKNGATTLYENWKITGNNDLSMNHIMFGEIGAWYYKALGGIKPDSLNPGFRNVLLNPHFVPGLDSFAATHNGPYGDIVSSWNRRPDGSVEYRCTIPLGSTAELKLEREKPVKKLKAGSYAFVISTPIAKR